MPIGRILLKAISDGKRLTELKTDGARLLFTWLIPHLDCNGSFYADPLIIKGRVFTRLKKSIKVIQGYLDDLESAKLIKRYKVNGEEYLVVPDFREKQPYLREERESRFNKPLPPNDGVTPAKLPPKVNQSKVNEIKENEIKEDKFLKTRKKRMKQMQEALNAKTTHKEV